MKKRLFQVLFLFLLVLMLPFSQKIGGTQVMAAEEGTEQPGYANLPFTLKTIDGETISTLTDGKRTTVLVFGGTTCGRTQSTIRDIATSSSITKEDARIIYINCDPYSTMDDVKRFASEYGMESDKIAYYYNTIDITYPMRDKYLGLFPDANTDDGKFPVIILIDKNDRVRQFMQTGKSVTANELKAEIDRLVESGNPESSVTPIPTPTPMPTPPGLGVAPNLIFHSIDDQEVSTICKEDSKQPTILIFGKANCGKTKATIRDITQDSTWITDENVRVIFAESNGRTKEEVTTFAASYLENPITFCYDEDVNIYNAMFRYARLDKENFNNSVKFPLIALIDENNQVRKIMQDFQTKESILGELHRFTTPSNPDMTPPEVPTVTPIPNPNPKLELPSIVSGNTVSVNNSKTTMLIFGTAVSEQPEAAEARAMAANTEDSDNESLEEKNTNTTIQTIENIRNSDSYKNGLIHVIFAECGSASKEEIQSLADTFAGAPNIEFCYAQGEDDSITSAMASYAGIFHLPVDSLKLNLPFTVLIDQEDQVQNVLEGFLSTEEIEIEINGDPIPEEPTPTEDPEPTNPVNPSQPTGSPGTINTPLPTDTPTPTDTPEPTDTPIPTDTPEPTDTPTPTDTPEPTTSPAPIVSKVSGLKNVSGKNSIQLNWNKVSKADGYIIYQYKNSGWKQIASVKSGKNAYTVKKLKAGTNYRFAIKAYIMQDQKQTLSKSYTSVYAATKPAAPTVKAAAKRGKVTLSWKKVTGATGYRIRYKASKNGSWKTLKVTKKTSFASKELKYGKTYWFKVNAYKTYKGKTYTGTGKTKKVTVK